MNKANTVGEMFHHFIHGAFKEEKLGNYLYDSKELLYYNQGKQIIALKFAKDKTFIVNKDYYSKSGYSAYTFIAAIPPDYKCLEVSGNLINKFSKYTTIKSIPKTLMYLGFFSAIQNRLAYYYDHLSNLVGKSNLSYNSYSWCNIEYVFGKCAENYTNFLDFDKFLKWKPNITTIIPIYKWWSTTYKRVVMDKPLHYYVYFLENLTEEEKDTLSFKKWKYESSSALRNIQINLDAFYYCNINRVGRGDYKKIWKNPEYKEKFDNVLFLKKIEYQKLKVLREKEEAEKRMLVEREVLDKWLEGGSSNHWVFYSIPIYLRISGDLIETTKQATIPIEHAKLLYKKFKKCIETNTPWHTNGSSIKIGHYYVQKIDIIEGYWYIQAGCHTIYQEQIEDFITRNNLNW